MPTTLKTIPKGWEKVNLGVACNFERGIEPGADAYNSDGVGERFLRVVDITESRNDPVYVDIRTIKKLKENDIALTLDGTIGAIKTGLTGIYSTGIRKVSFKNGVNSNRLLYYILQSNTIQRIIDVYASGSTIKHASSAIPHLFTVIPNSSSERNKIVEILSTIDGAIEKTDALIEKYKRMKTGTMQDLFRYGIDDKGNIRSEKTHKFKNSPLGRIPEEWEVKDMGALAEYIGSGVTPTGGQDVYVNEGIKFIRSQNVHFQKMSLDEVVYIDKRTHNRMKRSEIFPNDILLNITGASIGRCCVVPENLGEANVNQHVCAIRLNDKNYTTAEFLSYFISTRAGQNQIDILNAGSNRQGLNYQQVRAIKLVLPKKSEIERIAPILIRSHNTIGKEEYYKQKLLSAKSGLMEDLLTGTVRVNHLAK